MKLVAPLCDTTLYILAFFGSGVLALFGSVHGIVHLGCQRSTAGKKRVGRFVATWMEADSGRQ